MNPLRLRQVTGGMISPSMALKVLAQAWQAHACLCSPASHCSRLQFDKAMHDTLSNSVQSSAAIKVASVACRPPLSALTPAAGEPAHVPLLRQRLDFLSRGRYLHTDAAWVRQRNGACQEGKNSCSGLPNLASLQRLLRSSSSSAAVQMLLLLEGVLDAGELSPVGQ